MSKQPMQLLVMVSGGGTNLQALIDAIEGGDINAEITHVISNRKKAYSLERAHKHNIDSTIVSLKKYKDFGKDRESFDIDLAYKINRIAPDLVILAGWMHILSETFFSILKSDIINLHPALPNMFNGVNAIERAYKAYQNKEIVYSGCMVHHVIPEVDAGDVVIQQPVLIFYEDTLEDFGERMHETEHQIIVEAVNILEKKRR